MTADGRGRERGRPSGLSRRRLLAGLGSIGAISAASGAGTFAYLSDEEAFERNETGAGEVDLDVSCVSRAARCTAVDDQVSVTPENPIDRGDSGEAVVTVGVRTNPARLWFATTCPPAGDRLGEALEVSLRVDSDRLFDGSLSALRREFIGGVRLDDDGTEPCLDPDGEPVEIEFGWTLPDDAPATDGSTRTGFEFHLYAEQCRHVSEAEAAESNPFAGADPCDSAAVSDKVNTEPGGEDRPTESDVVGENDEPGENNEPKENNEPDERPNENNEPDERPNENNEDDGPARSANPNDPDSRARPGGQNRKESSKADEEDRQ